MTTTAKLTHIQQRVIAAVGDDWRSTAEIRKIAGVSTRPYVQMVLSALYTRRLVDRRQIEDGRSALEWRLEPV